jgi:hypothetical protein
MVLDKPQLLFQAEVRRKVYTRRFFWLILAIIAIVAAWLALKEAVKEEDIDPKLLDVGQFIALILIVILSIRAAITFARMLTVKNEQIRVFDRGFTWTRGKKDYRYSWSQLKTFREGARTISLFGRPLVQVGALTLTMRDDATFKITSRHGDTREFVTAVRPFIADITGTVMGLALRQNKSVRLHPKFILAPSGVVAGKDKIRWSELDIVVKRGSMFVKRLNKKGKFKTVKKFSVHDINNLAGFLDVADSVIRNHQPERFAIRTKGMAR